MNRLITILTLAMIASKVHAQSAEKIVIAFLQNVRSGAHPERARLYMKDTVLAHQITSEKPVTVKRTPEDYANHVREFHTLFGNYEFEITELIAQGDKVYARWKQTGKHSAEIDGFPPTNQPLIEYASAVYRVHDMKIAEYWIQIDRLGIDLQLRRNAEIAIKE